jgi:hypothetical protein
MVKNQKNPLFLIESQYYRKLKGANIGFPFFEQKEIFIIS